MSGVRETPAGVDRRAATLVLVGTLTTMAGATIAPAIPDIRSAFADSANVDLLARLVITTHALAIVLFSPVAGMLVDRLGRKSALLVGLAAFGVGGSSGAWLPSLVGIFAGRILLGVGVSLIMTSSVAMIADLYQGETRMRLMGRQVAATAFGGMVFLLAGGALAELDWRVVFLIYLLGSLLAVPVVAYLPPGRPTPESGHGPVGGQGRAGRVPAAVLAPLSAMVLGQVVFYAVPVQVPFLVTGHFGDSAFAAGAVIAAMVFSIGMVALGFATIRKLADEHTLIAVSFMLLAAGAAVLYLAGNLVVLTLGLLVMAAGLGVIMPGVNNWVVSIATPESRARLAGLLTTGMFLGQFISPIVTQPIVTQVGIQASFAVIAAILVFVSAGYLLLGWKTRPASDAGR